MIQSPLLKPDERRVRPDFDEQDFAQADAEFHARERRFGRVMEAV